jgi:hypothetical protein
VKAKGHLAQRPKNHFHNLPKSDEAIDCLVDMRPTLETAPQYLEPGMTDIRTRILNEPNNTRFAEIQEKWASMQNKSHVQRLYIP